MDSAAMWTTFQVDPHMTWQQKSCCPLSPTAPTMTIQIIMIKLNLKQLSSTIGYIWLDKKYNIFVLKEGTH